MSKVATWYEEASEEWVGVNVPMTTLVGTPAMAAGNLLWLDDGKRYLVGDVNWHFGTGDHCKHPCIPIVRAWRSILDVGTVTKMRPEDWATAFDHDEDVFDFVDEDEYAGLAEVVIPANTVQELDLSGSLKPGMLVGMDDGRVVLVGHVNQLAGVCDSETYDVRESRIVRYVRAVPDEIFRARHYEP